MESILLLSIICLLHQIQGSSAKQPKFVLKGKNVLLNVQKPVDPKEDWELTWKFNMKINILKLFQDRKLLNIFPNYKGRVEIFEQNHTLLLKNLTESDSGVYTAKAITKTGEERTVAEHNIIVQGPVPPPELRVESDVLSAVCHLTVTCSSHNSHINSTFTCNNHTCNQDEKERPEVKTSNASLRIYLSNDSIICNHSNQVNFTVKKREIKPLCSPEPGPEHISIIATTTVISVTTLVLVVIIGTVVGVCFYKKCGKYQTNKIQDTEYADPQRLNPSPVESPDLTIYSMAGPPTAPTGSPQPTSISVKESVYAQVMK